ncbi:murein transglycosylase A [Pseudochelatococcus sp. G4_1912]|uniref:murein transglycosylase A n=1 Tax=Pseudochelatococcus sp. G4_1912 TaxID=3114288 RepID=UPI0039C610BD
MVRASANIVAEQPVIEGASLEPLAFSALSNWVSDDHAAALVAFRRTCIPIIEGQASLRQSIDVLRTACTAALKLPVKVETATARQFFEQHFQPFRVKPDMGKGFLTGYYEPEFHGRLQPTDGYDTPLLSRPDDLVTVVDGETLPNLDPALRGARRIITENGERFESYPDRAAIEDGVLADSAQPLVYLERVDAFMAHVQGSVRVRLGDGHVRRFAYAGRNGHAYTSVARRIVDETGIAPKDLTAPKLVKWLRANPLDARRLMRENRSYIFFRYADELSPHQGPVGAASVPLEPVRSIAIDHRIWAYGLPIWIEAHLPDSAMPSREVSWERLMIAQDTGSAIIGPARADLFMGSGEAAGAQAGLIRHVPERFIVLLPISRERD